MSRFRRSWGMVPTLAFLLLGGPVLSAQELRPRQLIDREIKSAWQQKKITPAGRSSDSEFLRRVYLDLAGSIPTAEETVRFLEDKDPAKRDKVIDRLLADPRFAVQQANVWDLLLFGRNPPNYETTSKRDSFKKFLVERFAKNEPYDRWVRDLLQAEQPGTAMFLVQYRNQPEDATVAVSRIFLGTQLQCARCHDHPYEPWTQKDFYGMAGFFVRVMVLNDASGMKKGLIIGEKSSGEVLFTGSVKDQKPGQKGEPIKPKFLGGPALDEPLLPKGFKEPDYRTAKTLPKPPFSRKEKLAAWVTSADNPYFARAVVNRVWSQFLGRGFVHPVDDLSDKNAPSHPELFAALTDGLIKHKFDLKWLIRELVSSEAYQLASAGPGSEAFPPWFERGRTRPLSAEELMAALRVATGNDTPGNRTGNDATVYFLKYFGEPTNGRGDFQGGLSEHLFLNNSSHVRQFIQRRKGNLADSLLTSTEPWEKRVDRMFLSVLNRPPTTAEQKRFVQHLTTDPKKPDALVEEAIWVLVNCAEFRFNH